MNDSIARCLFDAMPWPLWVVDAASRLGDANGRGRRLLALGQGVRLWGERLLPAAQGAERGWRCALQKACEDPGIPACAPVEPAGNARFVFAAMSGESAGDPAVVVTLAAPTAWQLQWRALREAFGLSPAETRLLEELAGGSTLKEACDTLGVREPTGRTQLHALFAKTGTRRQAELLMLAQSFAPVAAPMVAPVTAPTIAPVTAPAAAPAAADGPGATPPKLVSW